MTKGTVEYTAEESSILEVVKELIVVTFVIEAEIKAKEPIIILTALHKLAIEVDTGMLIKLTI